MMMDLMMTNEYVLRSILKDGIYWELSVSTADDWLTAKKATQCEADADVLQEYSGRAMSRRMQSDVSIWH